MRMRTFEYELGMGMNGDEDDEATNWRFWICLLNPKS